MGLLCCASDLHNSEGCCLRICDISCPSMTESKNSLDKQIISKYKSKYITKYAPSGFLIKIGFFKLLTAL